MAKITGIGGIFFKSQDPKGLAAWYRDVLGLAPEDWGGVLFRPGPEAPPMLVWSPFSSDSDYFAPSAKEFMVNFAVDDLEGLLAAVAAKGVKILGHNKDDPNGHFAWILDPEGNKIELWQPK